jgi:hypothetical protein
MSWQTPPAVEATHRSPDWQSRDSAHSAWHRANAHTSGESQSLLIEQLPATLAPDDDLPQLDTAPATDTASTKKMRTPIG